MQFESNFGINDMVQHQDHECRILKVQFGHPMQAPVYTIIDLVTAEVRTVSQSELVLP